MRVIAMRFPNAAAFFRCGGGIGVRTAREAPVQQVVHAVVHLRLVAGNTAAKAKLGLFAEAGDFTPEQLELRGIVVLRSGELDAVGRTLREAGVKIGGRHRLHAHRW